MALYSTSYILAKCMIKNLKTFCSRPFLKRTFRKEKTRIWNTCDILNQEASTSQYVVMILNTPIALDFPAHFILNLWQKALLRITVDGGTNRWLSWLKLNNCDQHKCISPDLITGDMDSVSKDVIQYFVRKNKNIHIINTPDQNETDFTKALKELHKHIATKTMKVDVVLVLVDTSGRFDQILANIHTLFKARNILPDVDIVLLASDSLTWLLSEGVVHKINIPLSLRENQEWCSLIPVGSPCKVTSTGLKWNLCNTVLEFGKLISTSNTYNGESFVTVQTDNPLVWSMGIGSIM